MGDRSALIAVLCAVLSIAALAGGCAEVRPWERGAHADRRMGARPCARSAALQDRALQIREGGMTATGASGSGCGCD